MAAETSVIDTRNVSHLLCESADPREFACCGSEIVFVLGHSLRKGDDLLLGRSERAVAGTRDGGLGCFAAKPAAVKAASKSELIIDFTRTSKKLSLLGKLARKKFFSLFGGKFLDGVTQRRARQSCEIFIQKTGKLTGRLLAGLAQRPAHGFMN